MNKKELKAVQLERAKTGRIFGPSLTARLLRDTFGHKLTPNALRKYDRLIYSKIYARKSGHEREFTSEDIEYFNLIAVLRNLGYSIKEILEIVKDIHAKKGDSLYIREINLHMYRQEKAYAAIRSFFNVKSP